MLFYALSNAQQWLVLGSEVHGTARYDMTLCREVLSFQAEKPQTYQNNILRRIYCPSSHSQV